MRKYKGIYFFVILFLAIILLWCGYLFISQPSSAEWKRLENPTADDLNWLNQVSPLMAQWMGKQEAVLATQGKSLTMEEMKIAQEIGVASPEKVRVLIINPIPSPQDSELSGAGGIFQPDSLSEAGGLTLGYLILIHPKYEKEKWILAHELVHVRQQEQMGKEAFCRRYLLELRTVGYQYSPLEVESEKIMKKYEK